MERLLTAMVSTHPTNRRDICEVSRVLIAVGRELREVAIPKRGELVCGFWLCLLRAQGGKGGDAYWTSTASGHAIIFRVAAYNAAAPGPAGDQGTNPAPSFSLVPIIAGYSS